MTDNANRRYPTALVLSHVIHKGVQIGSIAGLFAAVYYATWKGKGGKALRKAAYLASAKSLVAGASLGLVIFLKKVSDYH